MSWIAEALSKWGIEPSPECNLCWWLNAKVERLEADLLATRLEVVDGPRERVKELEVHLARANALIAQHNEGKRK